MFKPLNELKHNTRKHGLKYALKELFKKYGWKVGVALFFYYYGLQHLPASHTTIYELVWPLAAVFLDWVIRGRILDFTQFVGAGLLLGSMIYLTREKTNG